MEIDYLVMLSILKLHRGKSIKLVDGVLSDVAGINDIDIDGVLCYLLEKVNINMSIKNLNDSINRLISKGHLFIRAGRLCPSSRLIHYFVEILQYEEDINESLKMLSRRMSCFENQ